MLKFMNICNKTLEGVKGCEILWVWQIAVSMAVYVSGCGKKIMEKMNILMLAPLPPPSGGIASWTVRYREYCKTHGIGLSIINIAMTGERTSSETMKKNIVTEIKRAYRIIRDFRRELKRKPDVVHINSSCSPTGILRDAICAYMVYNQVPIVLHCHCNIEDQITGKHISMTVLHYLIHKSNQVIVLNKFSQKYVDAVKKGRTIIIPNFVSRDMVIERHDINKSIGTVVYVGHMERAKGIVQITEAARLSPGIKFILVGAISENISKINMPPNVQCIGGVALADVRKYLEMADVFLFPSVSEGFSNALLEAMAVGLPIIASNVGANADMIENKGGIILKENTGSEIYEALNYMQDYRIRKAMSEWNIKKVMDSYIAEKVMGSYMNLYAQISGR